MQYREGYSILGFGCMRFATKGSKIDMQQTEQQILRAYELGVNYFDTAYIYPGSEEALGKILEKNQLREKIQLATKLPQYLVKNREGLDKYLNEELKRLRTNYLDVYLLHHMTDLAQWERLEKMGIREWIQAKKDAGIIKKIGFSFHGSTEMFQKILMAYDWDMCLVQYNYMDEHTQAGQAGVRAAHEKGIPVMIMEPLRGGKLVDLLPAPARTMIEKDPHGWTPAEWAFRWLWNQEEVTCVLSGMNSMEMLEANCKTASEAEVGAFANEEEAFIEKIRGYIRANTKVDCTGCRYCMPCPKGVDIPAIFSCYNHMFSEGKKSGRFEYLQTMALRVEPASASLCVKCGKCEQHCPQSVPIREKLVEADKALQRFPYRTMGRLGRRFMVGRKKKG